MAPECSSQLWNITRLEADAECCERARGTTPVRGRPASLCSAREIGGLINAAGAFVGRYLLGVGIQRVDDVWTGTASAVLHPGTVYNRSKSSMFCLPIFAMVLHIRRPGGPDGRHGLNDVARVHLERKTDWRNSLLRLRRFGYSATQ
jgi:hypothetical protein